MFPLGAPPPPSHVPQYRTEVSAGWARLGPEPDLGPLLSVCVRYGEEAVGLQPHSAGGERRTSWQSCFQMSRILGRYWRIRRALCAGLHLRFVHAEEPFLKVGHWSFFSKQKVFYLANRRVYVGSTQNKILCPLFIIIKEHVTLLLVFKQQLDKLDTLSCKFSWSYSMAVYNLLHYWLYQSAVTHATEVKAC